jgi:hypothetical protein
MTQNKLLLLGAISIIAIVGLVLLFTNQMAGMTQFGIGDSYGTEPGIAPLTKLPPRTPFGQAVEFPAGPSTTIGTRTPIMIFFRGEYGNIADMSKCWADLTPIMAAPQEAFSCYQVPTSGPAYEVVGSFWPTSSAMPKPLYQLGGDMYCYENSLYDRAALFDTLHKKLADKWEVGTINGQDVMLCQKGAYFIFPQGYPQY